MQRKESKVPFNVDVQMVCCLVPNKSEMAMCSADDPMVDEAAVIFSSKVANVEGLEGRAEQQEKAGMVLSGPNEEEKAISHMSQKQTLLDEGLFDVFLMNEATNEGLVLNSPGEQSQTEMMREEQGSGLLKAQKAQKEVQENAGDDNGREEQEYGLNLSQPASLGNELLMEEKRSTKNEDPLLTFTKSVSKMVSQPILETPAVKILQKQRGKMGSRNSAKAEEESRRSERIASKPKTNMTVEQQATALLVKKSGFLAPNKEPDEAAHARFRAQFTQPLPTKTIQSFQGLFGIEGSKNGECMAVVVEADA